MITIYHNPACSKSRAALELLRARGVDPTIVEYLDTPPDAVALRTLLDQLGITPIELIRRGDAAKAGISIDSLPDAALVQCLAENPALIERPIVVSGNRAVIGRPTDRILELL